MRIYPAPHYTMGGLWVDYHLMTTIPGLFAIGESNFSDHGANRLGASALMQGLADGYFVLPYTIGDYLAPMLGSPWSTPRPASSTPPKLRARIRTEHCSTSAPTRSVDHFHKNSARSCGTTAAWPAPGRAGEGPVGDPGSA